VWPHMESLMMGPRMYGEGLVTLLRHIPQFKKLELHKATIDLGFYESLPRHFNSLVELSLYSCKYVAGPFPPELLESAPNLKVFMCGSMNARDVVKGGPWVCQSLEKLRIRFNFSDDEQGLQPLVFERISQLTRLQVLGNFGWGDVNDVAYQESLDFRLECGLGSLATLSAISQLPRLKVLGLCEFETQFLKEDTERLWGADNFSFSQQLSFSKLESIEFVKLTNNLLNFEIASRCENLKELLILQESPKDFTGLLLENPSLL
ncbi:hypothetical protein BGZ76_003025, partial [Entomortierella beljakovae]